MKAGYARCQVAIARFHEEGHCREKDRLHAQLRSDGWYLVMLLGGLDCMRLLPERRKVALAIHVVVLRDHVHIPAINFRVRGQCQRQRVGGVGECRENLLICQGRELEDKRGMGRCTGHGRHGEDVPHQQDRGLPNSPSPILSRHGQALVSHRAQVLRVPMRVRVAHCEEHAGEVTTQQNGAVLPQGLAVGPLCVRGFAGDLAGHVLGVEGREDVRE
mmetsp:Transcript_75459/g.212545  ORF Transcript_75459/g.212545 Transcript_75459/m.212545 type:complete len:217 (-) Transcript_75459:638-1288(-)